MANDARSGGFFCTECCKEVDAPDLSGLGVETIKRLCRSWLCNDCLDFAEGVGVYAPHCTPILPQGEI